MKEIGIYIHIPFCNSKCFYCDFNSFEGKEDKIEEYINTLLIEIESCAKTNFNVKTIYIGGGTPSFINEKYIEKIVQRIKEKFIVNQNAEITIEANPGTLNLEKLENYYKCGINRLSIGLQSTDNNSLKSIGRIHTYEEFLENYNLARKVGFNNINVDLILALPKVNQKSIQTQVKEIINLNPEHISVYSLILEENTKLYNLYNEKQIELPNDEEERKMYWDVKKLLEKNNYEHYEISNFAKKGFYSKHNEDCWNQKEYLGFGAGASSYFKKIRYSNPKTIEEYIENFDKKEIEEVQTREAEAKEYMMLGLRKIEGASISSFEQKFKINPLFYFRFEISKLVEEELIEVDLDNIKLTPKGLDLANLVFEEFV